MADGTAIEWTEVTWNPITGCSVLSPGCKRLQPGESTEHSPSRVGLTIDTEAGPVWNGEVRLNEQWLDQPLRWYRPHMIFVCAHGDLFHESVPDEWIDRVFAVMALAPQHTFQVLTKRSARMRAYLSAGRAHPITLQALGISIELFHLRLRIPVGAGLIVQGDIAHLKVWPLPNVWLGVSTEDQKRADERIPDLLATPAAVRWISAEPLVGPIILAGDDGEGHLRGPAVVVSGGMTPNTVHGPAEGFDDTYVGLDWVVVGGESGPGARPMHPDWARSLRDQCAAAGVPFFFKQWGAWAPSDTPTHWAERNASRDRPVGFGVWASDAGVSCVGKARAGSVLDGAEHKAWPATFDNGSSRQ